MTSCVQIGIIAAWAVEIKHLVGGIHWGNFEISVPGIPQHKLLIFVCMVELLYYGCIVFSTIVVHIQHLVRGQRANEIHAVRLWGFPSGSIPPAQMPIPGPVP